MYKVFWDLDYAYFFSLFVKDDNKNLFCRFIPQFTIHMMKNTIPSKASLFHFLLLRSGPKTLISPRSVKPVEI